MITRINFLEKKRLQVTYEMMALGIGCALFFCLLIYGFLWFNNHRAQQTIATLQADIDRLKKERERLINEQSPIEGGRAYALIQQALEKTPPWEVLINAVIESLPPRVWLGSLKSAFKGSDPSKREIIMNGQAKGAQVLALFLANLEKKNYFEKVTLTTSTEEATGVFQFTIACDIGKNPWNLKPPPNPASKF